MKIRTDVILRLRDHLLDDVQPSTPHSLPTSELARAILRRVEPYAALMHAVVTADTVVEPAERTALLSALDILCGGAVDRSLLESLIDTLDAADMPTNAEHRIAAATARIGQEREDRETAFLIAAAVALADDAFEPREARVMAWSRSYLGITERRMHELLSAGLDQPK